MAVSSLGNSPGMLQSRAYEYIKRKILNDDMEVGVYYSETKLAQELNISRTPDSSSASLLESGWLYHDCTEPWLYTASACRLDVRETVKRGVPLKAFVPIG